MDAQSDFHRALAALRAGDEHGADALYRTYNPMISRYVASQEPRVADDLIADVWAAAIHGIDRFEGDESGFRSWLFTIARRRIIEHRRRGLRRRTDAADPEEFRDMPSAEDVAERAAQVVDATEAIELIAQHLSADQAEVLVLRVVGDLSAAQVAQLLDRTEAWVRITQHRALKKLAAVLDARMQVTR